MSVKKRFIDSIEYLRKLGFFEEYSNLSSEEIFEEISEGSILLKDLDKKEEEWAKESIFNIDVFVASEDKNRIWWFDPDEVPNPGVGLKILSGLARISRGVFQPTNVREEHKIEEGEYGLDVGYCRVYFTYEGKEEMLEFPWSVMHSWKFGHPLNHLNRLLQHTRYQYYQIDHPDLYLFIVLRRGEAKRLRVERGWKLSSIW